MVTERLTREEADLILAVTPYLRYDEEKSKTVLSAGAPEEIQAKFARLKKIING